LQYLACTLELLFDFRSREGE